MGNRVCPTWNKISTVITGGYDRQRFIKRVTDQESSVILSKTYKRRPRKEELEKADLSKIIIIIK